MELVQYKPIVEKAIQELDGVMIIVSAQTSNDPLALWEIDCSSSNCIPIVGVDVRRNYEGIIPTNLVGKMTRYVWEWFAEFFNRL
ncbi:MAG: hypothetical protein HN978_19660 [Desulfobacula sp.]|jgi:hypothetical protein|nr:hypothetical protein [Desulfobacula sp.]MBT7051868.1 hypothetical protein [Desulfobacula sp.]